MDCKQAQVLLIPHILGDLDPDSRQCRELEAHLLSCQACAEEYENSKWVVEFIQEHKALFAEAFETIDKKRAAEQEEIKRSWQAIQAKLDKIQAQERKEKQAQIRRVFVRVSAVAACLVIGILTWITFSIHSTPKIAPKLTPQQITSAPKPSVRIELVSKNGNILVPANQQIVSADKLKTLLINGKHRMVLNSDTALSIDPLLDNERVGCMVKLASGEIFIHVEHNGNPFVVSTAYGKAIITGTTLDVKAADTSTTLVVSEGTVQFESEKGTVKVEAGQISQIVAQSAPAQPVSCNTAELTAWATGYKAKPELAEDKSRSDIVELFTLWPDDKEPPVLEEVDYSYWVKQKRNWFRLQFPQIFQLQHALDEEGIEVKYPELLIKSGNLWQFAYIKGRPDRFSVLSFDSLLKTASDYGFDKQWLLENVTAAKYALENPALLKNSLAALNAFGQWSSSFENAQNSSDWVDYDDLFPLFHASVYLTETRSLLWFAVRKGQYDLTDKERAEVLALLQKQVSTSSICQENALHQPYKKEQICDPVAHKEDNWYKWADVITKNIKAITSIEEKITEYEIGK